MKEILDILLKHNTGNSELEPSQNILPALKDVGKYLKEYGIYCEIQKYNVPAQDGRDVCHCNLIAYKPNKNPVHKYILFQGHIDTIPAQGDYFYRTTDGQVGGRGAVDMKGSLAGMIKAFVKTYSDGNSALLITGDEEANGFAGIYNFLKHKHPPILFAINGEPNGLTISKKMKGVMMFDLEKSGTNGHSSSHYNDMLIENSIPLLFDIKEYIDEARLVKNDGFGNTGGALTIVQAGKKANQLPDNIKIHFHLRTVEHSGKYPFKINLNGFALNQRIHEPISVEIPVLFYENMSQAFASVGMAYKESVFAAFSEAVIINDAGIPAIVFGVGNLENAHADADREVVNIKDIENYSAILENFIKNIKIYE